jgi:hypothetical protein
MNNIETKSRFERLRLPLCVTTAIVSIILAVGGGLSSTEAKAFEITPSADPTPALNVDNSSATATLDNRSLVTYTPTSPADQDIQILTPVPRAADGFDVDANGTLVKSDYGSN